MEKAKAFAMIDDREAFRLCVRPIPIRKSRTTQDLRGSRETTSGLFVFAVLAGLLFAAVPANAQTDRYLSRSVGEVFQGTQITESECHAAGPMGDEVSCDRDVDCCFDQPNGCEGTAPTGSRCRGGAGPDITVNEGFPRVASRVGSVSAGLSGTILSISGVFAIADSDGIALDNDPAAGGLAASCGIVTLTTDEVTQIPITQTDIEIPITSGIIARCTIDRTIENGLSVIEVTVVLVEAVPDGAEIMRANALAGLELPFTTGGACAIGPAGGDPGWEIAAWLTILALASRRRRKP